MGISGEIDTQKLSTWYSTWLRGTRHAENYKILPCIPRSINVPAKPSAKRILSEAVFNYWTIKGHHRVFLV